MARTINKQWLKLGLPVILFIIILGFLWLGLNRDPHRLPSTLIGKPVPVFKAQGLLHPGKILTNRLFRGHISLLNVFASWCTSCRAEHAVLMDIANQHIVTLYGLNYKDQLQEVKRWLHRSGDPYQAIIFDPTGKIGRDFGVYGTPETFIIDQHGIVRHKYIGPISPDAWQDVILPAVKRLKRKNKAKL